MRTMLGSEPSFQVSRRAEWTIRALSGEYAREADKIEATPGPYRLIGESIESFSEFAAIPEDEGKPNRLTPDGRPYLSSALPRHARVARRKREPA
jgi:hypothetical protein